MNLGLIDSQSILEFRQGSLPTPARVRGSKKSYFLVFLAEKVSW